MKHNTILHTLKNILFITICSYSHCTWAEFSGLVKLASDYISQGVSQTQNKPAIQTILNYAFTGTNMYVQFFGSNVDFGVDDSARVEFDFSSGYKHHWNENWNIDTGVGYYAYQGNSSINFGAIYTKLNYKFLKLELYYSNNTCSTGTDGMYGALIAKYEIFQHVKQEALHKIYLIGLFGHTRESQAAGGNYSNYMLGIVKEIKGTDFEIGWSNTYGLKNSGDLGTHRIFFSVTKKF